MGLFHCMAEDGIEDGKNAQFNSGLQGKIAMTTISSAGSIPGAGTGFLDKERTIATAGFNRWLVPPAALCIHLCIGMAYGFSVFWLPLSRALEGRLRIGPVLVRRPLPRRARRLHPSALVAVAGLGRDRRHRSWPRLHLAGVDAGEMVPGPARHGDRHGHHGLWRRRHDWRAAGEPLDELFQDPDLGRRLGNLRRHGRDLFRVHDDRRIPLPHSAGWLAARGLDPAGKSQRDDLAVQRAPQRRA